MYLIQKNLILPPEESYLVNFDEKKPVVNKPIEDNKNV